MKINTDPRLPIVTDGIAYLRQLNARLYELFRDVARSINSMSDGFLLTTTVVTGDYIVHTADQLLLIDNAAPVEITLPDAVDTKNKRFIVKKISNNTYPVTVISTGGLVEDDAEIVIDIAYTSIDLVSDGTDYWII